ncbi:phage tail tape measure protein [Pyruvatibacter mobilis]|uniref:phage tail tape measure protein n=1 Tax=Pyruvatibacter mobilis TaxID=1712261 RepID=UPI003BB1C3A9
MTEIDGLSVSVSADLSDLEQGMQEVGDIATSVGDTISQSLGSAFDRVILRGENLSDVLRDVALQASRSVFDAALDPIADGIGSIASNALGSLFAAANGAVVAGGNVRPFARGGVVSGPTAFPLTGGMGLMGEAGPEAILPLSRGSDGRLGVSAGAGAAPISVTVNVSTPDARSFQRSEAQIAGVMSRALARARRTQ